MGKKEKKEKELRDTDNSVVTAAGRRVSGGGRGYGRINGNRKNTVKIIMYNSKKEKIK